jgi:hypothetical protein
MVRTRKYYLKKTLFDLKSKVKVLGRSLWYTTHRLMVMIFGMWVHKRCVAYQNDLCLDLDLWPLGQVIVSFEIGQWYLVCGCMTIRWCVAYHNNLYWTFVKGQGPTKVITVCDTLPYGHAPTYQISLTYLEKNNVHDHKTVCRVP